LSSGCRQVVVRRAGTESRSFCIYHVLPAKCRFFSSGRCWVRTSGLLLVSSACPVTLRTGMSGKSAVLQHFSLRRSYPKSAAYRTVPSRLQYGCSTCVVVNSSTVRFVSTQGSHSLRCSRLRSVRSVNPYHLTYYAIERSAWHEFCDFAITEL